MLRITVMDVSCASAFANSFTDTSPDGAIAFRHVAKLTACRRLNWLPSVHEPMLLKIALPSSSIGLSVRCCNIGLECIAC